MMETRTKLASLINILRSKKLFKEAEDVNALTSECPSDNYYFIDKEDPPSIEYITKCWADNWSKVYDRSMPAMYNTDDLTEYREYDRGGLRNTPNTERYKELKESIEREGIKEPLHITVGRNGKATLGEGNHRHEIALELGIEKVPVFIHFWQNVNEEEAEEEVEENEYSEKDEDIKDLIKEILGSYY